MREYGQIWRSKLWSKRGDARLVIHVIAEPDATRFQVVALADSRPAVILGSGTAKDIPAATVAAESLAARVTGRYQPEGFGTWSPRSPG